MAECFHHFASVLFLRNKTCAKFCEFTAHRNGVGFYMQIYIREIIEKKIEKKKKTIYYS